MDYLNRGFAICNRCGAVMDQREDPRGGCDIYACPSCGWEIDEMEYEYESGDPMELVQDERGDDYLVFRNDMPPGRDGYGRPLPHRDHPADHVGAEDEAPAQAALGDGLRPYADLTTSFMRNQLILKGVAVYENIQEQAVRCGADALRKCSDIPGAGRHGAGIYRDDCSSAVLCKRKLDLLKGMARTRAFPFIFALISQLLLRRTMLVKGGKGAWTK